MDNTAFSVPSDKQVIVQNITPLKDVLSEHETAELLGVTVRTLREWHYRRIGPARVTFRQMIC
jgi:DNA-binding transcriptional regulator YiaG